MNAQVSEITEIPYENLLREFQLDPTLNTINDEAISLKLVKYQNQVVMFFYTAKGFAKTTSLDNGKTWSTAELFHELEDGRAPRNS
ncbi:MAG: hypothetical protein U5K00_24600 [Melioribacteraceae bacterium]|nr:hypothetical protein [Melioribacteraceae bacterium]